MLRNRKSFTPGVFLKMRRQGIRHRVLLLANRRRVTTERSIVLWYSRGKQVWNTRSLRRTADAFTDDVGRGSLDRGVMGCGACKMNDLTATEQRG